MSQLQNWLAGVVCAAMIASLAGALMPKGTIRKIGRFAGGLMLLTTLLTPLIQLDYEALAEQVSGTAFGYGLSGDAAAEMSDEIKKDIIEARISAYISDKAGEQGICCAVYTECRQNGDGVPYPVSVRIVGELTEEQRAWLCTVIEGELAIPASAQSYQSGD